jgi:hypothetical protein
MKRSSVVVFASLLAPGVAVADIVGYDTISNQAAPQLLQFPGGFVQAQDTTLDPSANLFVTSVELIPRMSSVATIESFTGSFHVELFSSVFVPTAGGNRPDQLLAWDATPISLTRGTEQLVQFNLNVAVPSHELFVAWYFLTPGGAPVLPQNVFVRQSTAAPSVGSTTGLLVSTSQGGPTTPNQWGGILGLGRNWTIRVNTVPTPASAIVAAAPIFALRRRRGQGAKA